MSTQKTAATIFVVDDDQGLLRLVQKALQREGFTVATASSAKQALAWLADHRPDLMLLDLKLRDSDGKDLIAHLVSSQRSLPFVIITGQGDERVAVEMMKSGALDYVVKDAEFIQFLPAVVHRTLERLAKEKRLAEAEEALRRTSAHLATAQEIAHFGSYQVDVPATSTSHWSAETFRILGLDPAGKDLPAEEYIRTIVHPDDRVRVHETLEKAVRTGTRYDAEYRIVRPDGTVRHVHSIAEPVLGPDKKVIRLSGTLQDITERRELERAVGEVTEREQRRIGRELHDGLGQQLTAIELLCESLRGDLAGGAPELQRQAGQVCQFLREAISQTRSLAHGLVAFKVETGGLQTALMELAQATSALGRVKCRLESPASVILDDREAATHLYRIAQEAVHNAVKHSHGTEVTIHLSGRNGLLRLSVSDNGKGFDRNGLNGDGIGLQLMKHRASVIGAELEVLSRPGKGVSVTCSLRRKQ